MQDCSNSSALAMELLLSCTKPSMCLVSNKRFLCFHCCPDFYVFHSRHVRLVKIYWNHVFHTSIMTTYLENGVKFWCILALVVMPSVLLLSLIDGQHRYNFSKIDNEMVMTLIHISYNILRLQFLKFLYQSYSFRAISRNNADCKDF